MTDAYLDEADLEAIDNFQAFLDSLPEVDPPPPNCGQCVHFVPERQMHSSDSRSERLRQRPITAPSHCSLRAAADLPCYFSPCDSYAEQCPFFEEAIPF